jgi:hypothetical protein
MGENVKSENVFGIFFCTVKEKKAFHFSIADIEKESSILCVVRSLITIVIMQCVLPI